MTNWKISVSLIIAALFGSCGVKPYSTTYNLDFEYATNNRQPMQWDMPDTSYHGYAASLDFEQKQHGQASLHMRQTDPGKSGWAIVSQVLPASLVAGRDVELSGWIKTQDVSDGFADLFLIEYEHVDYNKYPLDTLDRGVRNSTPWTQISLKRHIDERTSGVKIGGILKGPGVAWFDNLELTIDGERFCDTLVPAPKIRLTRKDRDELRKYIYPLRTFEPDDENTEDLKVLTRLVGGSSVVALGENSHGASEIYRMKERLIRYMAKNMGFDIFSIEANMSESYQMDAYIHEGQGSPEHLISGMGMWIWDTHEMLSLVEWMRTFNQFDGMIAFTGFDMQSSDESVATLKTALKDDEQAAQLLSDIEAALKTVIGYSSVGNPQIDSRIAGNIKRGLLMVESYIDRLSAEETEKSWLRQNVTLIRQFLGQGPLVWRDRCMADNLLWIKQQNPSSRIVIWAHNGHIEKNTGMMGDILQDSLKTNYVNFGFTFYDGKYTGVRRDSRELVQEAQRAYPGTLEYLLNKFEEPMFILDLKKIREDKSPVLLWIDDLWYRHVGVVKIDDEFPDRNITNKFDYLIFIHQTSPSNLFINDSN